MGGQDVDLLILEKRTRVVDTLNSTERETDDDETWELRVYSTQGRN